MLYCIFSVILQRLSVNISWFIDSTSSINHMNFQVHTPNVKDTVIQNRQIGQCYNLLIAEYSLNDSLIHLTYFFHHDNKPRHVQSMSLDVYTKNSVDAPPKVTIHGEGRPTVVFPYWFNSSWSIRFGDLHVSFIHNSLSIL